MDRTRVVNLLVRPALGGLAVLVAAVHLRADDLSDAKKKLEQLPPPPLVVTMDQAAGSPALVLTDQGAVINKSAPVPFEQVLVKLAALPADAWPCGRVILYSVSSAPQPAADKVEADLEAEGFRLVRS